MSRSRRKKPITGIAVCASERDDKRCWHQRLRARERTLLSGASPDALESHLPIDPREVSDDYAMSKDGRQYMAESARRKSASMIADALANNPRERTTLVARMMHRWMGK